MEDQITMPAKKTPKQIAAKFDDAFGGPPVQQIVEVESISNEVLESNDLEIEKQETSPLGAGNPLQSDDSSLPEDAEETVRNLIEGLNYLFKMAKQVRGLRGLKENDESTLRRRVSKGRELESVLAKLKQ
jgi:hypothetical protein